MRLIDADYAQRQLTIAEVEGGKNFQTDCNHVRDFLNAHPTIDAVPVKHGRWEKDPDMRRMNGHIYDYRCSRCHCSAVKGCYNNFDQFTNYCPNCGAKMDGGEAK